MKGQQDDAANKPQKVPDRDKELTRRQFLTYTLGGTAAFMAAMIFSPLVIEAFDPIHRSAGGSFSKTKWKVSEFDAQSPKHVVFEQHIDDGWNSQDIANDVYVIKYQSKLMIMSHVCTHLGCHVNSSPAGGKPEFGNGKEWFECPCHGSQYNIYGVQTPTSPAPRPLDLYYYRVDDQGYVEVGGTFQRTDSSWDYNPNPTVD